MNYPATEPGNIIFFLRGHRVSGRALPSIAQMERSIKVIATRASQCRAYTRAPCSKTSIQGRAPMTLVIRRALTRSRDYIRASGSERTFSARARRMECRRVTPSVRLPFSLRAAVFLWSYCSAEWWAIGWSTRCSEVHAARDQVIALGLFWPSRGERENRFWGDGFVARGGGIRVLVDWMVDALTGLYGVVGKIVGVRSAFIRVWLYIFQTLSKLG